MRDFRTNQYIAQEPDEAAKADEPLRPAWYWMLPYTSVETWPRLDVPTDRSGQSHVRVGLTIRGKTPDATFGVDWTLDEHGRFEKAHFSDMYGAYRTGERTGFEGIKIPDEDHWRLRPLPPRLPEYERLPGSPSPHAPG
jgi:hypothetical protein